MSWHGLAVSLRMRGDMHLGDMPLGFVARTHPFVPCHLPFFALIAVAVEELQMPLQYASYQAMEELFVTSLRSTAFFVRDAGRMLFPWVAKDRAVLESSYLDARYGVMVEDASRSACDGKLFETEVLLAVKRNSTQATCLEGAVFYRAGTVGALALTEEGALKYGGKSKKIAELLSCMRLGGDRTRALGLPAKAQVSSLGELLWGTYGVQRDCAWPELEVPKKVGGPMPLLMEGASDIEGRPMVLTGRRHTEQGAGLGMDAASAAYLPGWVRWESSTRIALVQPRYAACVVN